ncbi:MAG: flagellar export protein FliJ [Lachnospiraceae bacterium]|nr:flagellar export protein FliJ [Lachnospiraceae bacterium]
MAKFVFGLQNVLDIKEKIEAQARQDFANAAGLLEEQKRILAGLYERKEQLIAEGQELVQGKLDFREIDENRLAKEYIDRKIEDQIINVNKAEANVERARRKMSEAMAEKKTYERLRDKAFEEYLIEENRAESKVVDELTSYTYGQKTKA